MSWVWVWVCLTILWGRRLKVKLSHFHHIGQCTTSTYTTGFSVGKRDDAPNILLGICNNSSVQEIYGSFFFFFFTDYLVAVSNDWNLFPNLLIQNTDASNQSSCNCVFHYGKKTYASEKYIVTLKGKTIYFVACPCSSGSLRYV